MVTEPSCAGEQNGVAPEVPARMVGDGRHPRIGHPDVYRRFPSQGRARETVAFVLEVARQISHTRHVGLRDVASAVGYSTPAVYRYFEDVGTLRDALASQELELYFDAIIPKLKLITFSRWQDVVLLHIRVRVDSYRRQSGPAAITERYQRSSNESEVIASLLSGEISKNFTLDLSPQELHRRVEVSVRIMDTLVGLACQKRPQEKQKILRDCRRVVERYLALRRTVSTPSE